MKAVTVRQFGGPDVLRLEELPTPKPAAGEVLVKVRAVSVNRTLDLIVRAGNYRSDLKFPLVLGVDPAGVIVETAPGVSGPRAGERVAVLFGVRCHACRYCLAGDETNCANWVHIGLDRWGGYAEYVATPAENTVRLPDAVSFADGCVIARHCPLAFNQLQDKAKLKPGEWVLVMGAAGALGGFCVQVAKHMGAKVIAGAGSDERVRIALSHGADLGVNYREQDLAEEVMRVTEGLGADVVLENIGDPTLWPGAFNSLAIGGRLVTSGAHGGGKITLDVKKLYLRRLGIIGTANATRADVERSLNAAAEGKVRAVIDRILPLGQAAAAHRLVEDRAVLGKVILDPTL